MPKDSRDRSISSSRSCASPLPYSSSRMRQSKRKNDPQGEENVKEWEEARCPVCMEHPHNAVLLICSSHDKGCRPYMCDTSYRHSNCLDQFRKSFLVTPQHVNAELAAAERGSVGGLGLEDSVSDMQIERNEEGSSSLQPRFCENQEKSNLVCPLCRGQITGSTVVVSARNFMNAKSRSCALESCEFCGTYADLRKHARKDHPRVRPAEVDPERQRDWRRLERQRDLGDLISTLQSLGDVRSEDNVLSFDDGGWLTVYFLIRVFRSGSSSRSSSWPGTSSPRGQVTVRRRSTRLWGETYDGQVESAARDGDDESSDGGSSSRRTRRRLRHQETPEN